MGTCSWFFAMVFGRKKSKKSKKKKSSSKKKRKAASSSDVVDDGGVNDPIALRYARGSNVLKKIMQKQQFQVIDNNLDELEGDDDAGSKKKKSKSKPKSKKSKKKKQSNTSKYFIEEKLFFLISDKLIKAFI